MYNVPCALHPVLWTNYIAQCITFLLCTVNRHSSPRSLYIVRVLHTICGVAISGSGTLQIPKFNGCRDASHRTAGSGLRTDDVLGECMTAHPNKCRLNPHSANQIMLGKSLGIHTIHYYTTKYDCIRAELNDYKQNKIYFCRVCPSMKQLVISTFGWKTSKSPEGVQQEATRHSNGPWLEMGCVPIPQAWRPIAASPGRATCLLVSAFPSGRTGLAMSYNEFWSQAIEKEHA